MAGFIRLLFLFVFLINRSNAQEQPDSFRFSPDNSYPSFFRAKNWQEWSNSYSLSSRYIPYYPTFNFPALLFFSDTLFKGQLKGNEFVLKADIELVNCVFFDGSSQTHDYYFRKRPVNRVTGAFGQDNAEAVRDFIFPKYEKQRNFWISGAIFPFQNAPVTLQFLFPK
jgi:hypothetical protein